MFGALIEAGNYMSNYGFMEGARRFAEEKKGQAGIGIIMAVIMFIILIVVFGKLAPTMYEGLNDAKNSADIYGDTASKGIVMLIAFAVVVGLLVMAFRIGFSWGTE